jgi:hypothetical protein
VSTPEPFTDAEIDVYRTKVARGEGYYGIGFAARALATIDRDRRSLRAWVHRHIREWFAGEKL